MLRLGVLAAVFLLVAQAVVGATFITNSTFDYPDVNPGDGVALDENGRVTLRAAIEEANALPGSDHISFGDPFSALDRTSSVRYGHAAVRATLPITDDVVIDAGTMVIGFMDAVGSSEFRMFEVMPGVRLELVSIYIQESYPLSQNMVADRGPAIYIHPGASVVALACQIRMGIARVAGGAVYVDHGSFAWTSIREFGGTSEGDGGVIFNDGGEVYLNGDGLLYGTANGRGGGIFNHGGVVWLRRGDFRHCAAEAEGGAVYSDGGTIVMAATTIDDNSAASGGGVYLTGGAVMEVTGSSFTNNTVSAQGGGIHVASGLLRATQCTFGLCAAELGGGGIFLAGGEATLLNCTLTLNEGGLAVMRDADCFLGNTIVAANGVLAGTDVSGRIASLGHNLIGIQGGGAGYADTDLLGTEPSALLPGLEYTPRHEGRIESPRYIWSPTRESPAIDAGDSSLLASPEFVGGSCYDTRLSCCPRVRGLAVDIGAVEWQEGEANAPCDGLHRADYDRDSRIGLSELLRIIQLYNAGAFQCTAWSEDGYAPGTGDEACAAHSADYHPQDWHMDLNELLRVIQFFNMGGYVSCPDAHTEDGFCPLNR
ncbi:right-handed parallel beta-helix repeat-containing protein [Roseovarius pacificus]|uniref:right-handed parallel beta-helix repeat-containing protein n=1 Tax=Roseovarius pacificus TaxID=337701 RepID=UPI002A18983A|nr:right-handed parallel beta-helix repeat-containing protein [Roseovarius pacificus]